MSLLGCMVVMALTAPSDRFEIAAAGQPLAVEAFHDVSYARFTLPGGAPVPIEVHFKSKVRSARAIPASAVEGLTSGGNAIRFTLRRPANVALLVNQDQRLFLFADPPETEAPGAGALNVVERGADPTGKTPSTAALQKAIDAAAASGGTVLVPAGLFVTGTLVMRSRVTLYLAPGAVLRGSWSRSSGVRSGRKKALGTVEQLTFANIDAPFYERPASNWTWYAQFRPDAPAMYGNVPVFRGADAAHAVRGLTLRNITVGGTRLTDRAAAERIANLTIGPFVEGVVIE